MPADERADLAAELLAQEAAPSGVGVLAVAPGAILTPINRAVWATAFVDGDMTLYPSFEHEG